MNDGKLINLVPLLNSKSLIISKKEGKCFHSFEFFFFSDLFSFVSTVSDGGLLWWERHKEVDRRHVHTNIQNSNTSVNYYDTTKGM